MRKPGNSPTDDQALVAHAIPTIRRSGQGQAIPTCSSPLASTRSESHEENRLKYSQKLRDGSTIFNFQHQNIMLPSCTYPTKAPTIINFDFKQSSAVRSRKMEIPGITALLDGIHNSGGRNHRLEAILGNPTTSVRSKDSTKHIRKESLDFCRANQGTCSYQHQDGTYSSTSIKEQENILTHSMESYIDKPTKKQSKVHKTRHPSKSITMNLNEMIVGKRKSKTKRPLTSAPELNTDEAISTAKINSRIFTGTSKSSRKDKENLPPIIKPGQGQVPSDREDSAHGCCSNKNCSKCNSMAQKLKAQVQVAKTLQRQNGCLENIVTQKRNLVEQLTRQVRTLVRENQQLSKGCGKMPLEAMLNTESASATSIPKVPTISVLGCTGSLAALQPLDTYEDLALEEPESVESDDCRKARASKERGGCQSARVEGRKLSKKSESTEKLEEAEIRISTLSLQFDHIQQSHDHLQKENQEINRFLTDLLYTLNARGYESITDHEGNTIDLYRCKGDAFLDLKGRDARLRVPAKRLAPQETLLKAVIGSQERIIQNLICQLEDHQKDSMLGKRLSLDNLNGEEGNRSAVMEGEVLTLIGLLEGACQRSPEVLAILRDQHLFDSQVKAHAGLDMGNEIVETVLERCQKAITTIPPPAGPIRRRQRDYLNPRSGTPPPFQAKFGTNMTESVNRGPIYNENSIFPTPTMGSQRTNSSPHNPNKQGSNNQKQDHEMSPPKEMGQSSPRPQNLPEIPVRNRLLQISRSTTQNSVIGPLGPVRTNAPLISPNGNSPRGSSASASSPRLRQNLQDTRVGQPLPLTTGSSSGMTPMQKLSEHVIPCLNGDRCPYCSRQFSSSSSLAEINAHMEMHSYQAG